jgi:hypothetical protein
MILKILIAAVSLLSLPALTAATNYDVSIEENAQQYMCLDSNTGAYYVKVGNFELAGHSVLYSDESSSGTTPVEMYSPNMMCTGRYHVSKTKGIFEIHGWKDLVIRDKHIEDSGLCAVANKPPDIISIYATVPKAPQTPKPPRFQPNVLQFRVIGLLNDETTWAPGLEWELESNCFETVKGTGTKIDKTYTMFGVFKMNCKFKLIVEDAQEGYAFAEFFVPEK